MPVLVSLCHLFQDFDKVLVGRLYRAIHLRSIRRGSVTLDVEALQVVFDPLGYEVRAIIRDERVWEPILGYNVVSDKLFCSHDSDYFVGGCFHPLGKVVDRYQNVAMTVGGCWMYGADDIDPPSGERPWRRHVMQFLWGSVYEIPMDLATMSLAHKLAAVCLHG